VKAKKAEEHRPLRLSYRMREFAALTGIPYDTVVGQCRTGKIPTVMWGSIRSIPASYVEARLKAANAVGDADDNRTHSTRRRI